MGARALLSPTVQELVSEFESRAVTALSAPTPGMNQMFARARGGTDCVMHSLTSVDVRAPAGTPLRIS